MNKIKNFTMFSFAVLCLVFSSFAGGTLEIQGSDSLDYYKYQHSVEFYPNDSGHHWVNYNAGYINLRVHTVVYWASDASPSWTPFYSDYKLSDCVILYSGSDDVRFKIFFEKAYANTVPISWEFWKNDGN